MCVVHKECLGGVEVVAGRSLVVLSGLCGGFMAEEWDSFYRQGIDTPVLLLS